MSRVKIEGNATGSGTLTISAPATNTDRSLTLPDTAGEFVTADASGNVGIGTDSPDKRVTVRGSGPAVKVQEDGTNHYVMLEGGGSTAHLKFYDELRFSEGTTERMRIDSSGNVLVGKTSANIATVGHEMNGNNGYASHTRSGNTCLFLNRTTSDGDIAVFRKDGSTVGSISTSNSGTYIYFGSSAENVGLGYGGGFVFPTSGGSSGSDNSKDLGSPSYRWDDVYATNGTIQTSDQNEKQQIASLTDAEMNVAKRLSALFKTYKWNASVEENGDNARTHTGIIAQDMQQAFTDEGLDAGNYAMFISSTWWETSTDVPAVEAVDAVYETVEIPAEYDDEGNEISPATTEQRLVEEAVEAKDAYTRIDTFETQEEAPEGATERTRLGVRYPELFAFINAYNDQRFEALETRIEALENA